MTVCNGIERVAKVGALDVFHGDVGGAVLGLVEVDDFDDVGVAQLDGGLGLAPEAAQEGGVLG
jgi:hypothetical protein